jgi:serine protease
MKKRAVFLMRFAILLILGCQQTFSYFNLAVSVSGAGGTVVTYPNATAVEKDSSVLLTAVPSVDYVFDSWSGGITSTQNPISFTMNQDYTIEAHFRSATESAAVTAKYTLEAQWESYEKSSRLINTVASEKSIGIKAISSFKTANYFNLNTNASSRPKAILVKYKTGASQKSATSLKSIGTKDLTLDASVPFQRIMVDADKYLQIPSMLSYLKSQPDVEWAEEDLVSKALFAPDDEYYSYQWNFDKIGMPAAWDYTTGESDVIVAVIDTGAYFPLTDLGRTKFVQGFDFVNSYINPFDDNGHGSHVIGTIAESTDNGIGVAGMAPGIKIMPVKVLASDGLGYNSDVAQGIYFATNNGAHIINLSLGGNYSAAIEDAVNYAVSHGVLVVAAAGNDGTSTLNFPAALSNVLSVGATNDLNALAPYSNYGTGLDIVAPGGDLSRTLHNQEYNEDYPGGILQQTYYQGITDYWYFEGTSMAAPHVAGLAALLKSKNSGLTAGEIETIIKNTAVDLGASGYDTHYGYGLIDAAKALGVPGYIASDQVTSTIVLRENETEKWKIAAAPGTLTASLSYSNQKGTLSLSLENSAGTVAATGAQAGDTITLSYAVTSANKGDYYLTVKYSQ